MCVEDVLGAGTLRNVMNGFFDREEPCLHSMYQMLIGVRVRNMGHEGRPGPGTINVF